MALAPQVPVRTEVEAFPLTAASKALARLRSGSGQRRRRALDCTDGAHGTAREAECCCRQVPVALGLLLVRSGRRRLELGQLLVAQVDDVVAELAVQQLNSSLAMRMAGLPQRGQVIMVLSFHGGCRWTGLALGSPPPPAPPRTEGPASRGPSGRGRSGRRLAVGGLAGADLVWLDWTRALP